jgi:DnaJ-class molecular chaperone
MGDKPRAMCPTCNGGGVGKFGDGLCATCKGTGWVPLSTRSALQQAIRHLQTEFERLTGKDG